MCGTSKSESKTTNSFDPWVSAAGQGLYNSASAYAAANPYHAYTGPTAAAEDPAQAQAIGYASDNLGQTNPYTTQAAGMTQATASQIPQGADNSIAALMNPYAQSALAPTLRNISETAQRQTMQNGTNAAMNGAFGGSAQGVAQGLTNRYEQQGIGDATAQGMNTAFNAAQSQQNTNNQQSLAAANQLSGIGQNAFGQGTTLASLLGSLGAQQQGIQQQGITNAMAVNKDQNTGQLGQYATLGSLLGIVPKNTQGTEEKTQPDNSGLQLAGSIIGKFI